MASSASPTTGADSPASGAVDRYFASAALACVAASSGARIFPSARAASKATAGGVFALDSRSESQGIASASFSWPVEKATVASPLVQDGQKLIPSVTRVFSKSREMFVYLQAYEPGATEVRPLVAFVTFYRGQSKAFETPPLPASEPPPVAETPIWTPPTFDSFDHSPPTTHAATGRPSMRSDACCVANEVSGAERWRPYR